MAWEGRDSSIHYVSVCNIPSRTFHLLRTGYFTYLSKSGLFLVLWAFRLILLSTSLPSVPFCLHPLSSLVTLSFFYQVLLEQRKKISDSRQWFQAHDPICIHTARSLHVLLV